MIALICCRRKSKDTTNALNRCRRKLTEITQSDKRASSRAISTLVDLWKDDATRELLIEIAQSDKQASFTAISLLATHWKDDKTRELLIFFVWWFFSTIYLWFLL